VLGDIVDHLCGDRGRHHHPDRARRVERAGEIGERVGTDGTLIGQGGDRVGVGVEYDAVVPRGQQAPHQVRPHPPQADHSDAHQIPFTSCPEPDRNHANAAQTIKNKRFSDVGFGATVAAALQPGAR